MQRKREKDEIYNNKYLFSLKYVAFINEKRDVRETVVYVVSLY